MKTIIVCRCVQSEEGEALGYGFWQAHSVAKILQRRQFNVQRLVYCDAPTRQTATVIGAALQFYRQPEEIKSFSPPYKPSTLAELQALSKNGATVNDALRLSDKACTAKAQITKALLCLAKDMQSTREETALVVSHSLYEELAVTPDAHPVPFGLGEGDCMVYVVDEIRLMIVSSMHLPAAIPSHSKF